MGKINYFNYFTEIENYFLKKRKKGTIISPLDWALIETWKEMKIPLHVVIRGIEKAFENFEKKEKKFSRINSLYYCNQSVLEEFEKYILSTQDSPQQNDQVQNTEITEEIKKEKLTNFLNELIDKLSKTKNSQELCLRIRKRLETISKEMETPDIEIIERIGRNLKEIDDLVVEHLKRLISESENRELKKEVKKELRKYKGEIPQKMYSNLVEKVFKRKLKEKFGIGELSVLDLMQ